MIVLLFQPVLADVSKNGIENSSANAFPIIPINPHSYNQQMISISLKKEPSSVVTTLPPSSSTLFPTKTRLI